MRGTEDLLPILNAAEVLAPNGRPYGPGGIGKPVNTSYPIFGLISRTYDYAKKTYGEGSPEAGWVNMAFVNKDWLYADDLSEAA
jgi:hypothetical protein